MQTFTDDQRIAAARSLLDSVQNQVRVADEKIRAMFSANTLLAAALAFSAQGTLAQVQSSGWTVAQILAIGLRILLLSAVAFSTSSAILALLPRLKDRHPRSLFYFGDVAATPRDQFYSEFQELTPESSLSQLLSQIHVNATIVTEKYRWTRRAAVGLLVAVLTSILIQVVQFLG